MDEASQLVSELRFKLCELDHKVWKYGRDMASEFDKYAEALLRDVPVHVSETALRSIKESRGLYRSLYPEAEADADTPVESCATGSSTTNTSLVHNGIKSDSTTQHSSLPMPKPFERPEEEKESLPRSPHEREKEFQGLFTPRYLPLLDDSNRNERRSSATFDAPTSPKTEMQDKPIEEDIVQVDASTDTRSLQNSPQATRPPTPKRRNTDEVSIKSDWSDGPIRRSALRRLSSSSKGHSPRRVRFDVEGEEVLPTSSPVVLRSPIGEMTELSFAEETEEEAGSEQIENVEELPPPKRISSSQALRAMSRSPLDDDGTQWTTVTAPPDGSASIATPNGFSDSGNEDTQNGMFGLSYMGKPKVVNIPKNSRQVVVEGDSAATEKKNVEAETPSDDEMLDIMAPLRRQSQSTASMLSPTTPADIDGNKSPTASTRSTGAAWKDLESFGGQQAATNDNDLMFDDDQEEMFNFDENVPPPGKIEMPLEDESSESEPELLIKSRKPTSQQNSYSRSPAREIIRPTASESIVPTTKGIVGSYKGHPFSMPVVSKEVHDQAASMGAVNFFVGSGRMSSIGGDAPSFSRNGGVGSFSGTPRSMSERMMMDDIMEAEENRRSLNGSKDL